MEDENMIYKKAIDAEQACDVLVVGGGPAGVCAAVSAARQGVKTILVERFGVLGGMMTARTRRSDSWLCCTRNDV